MMSGIIGMRTMIIFPGGRVRFFRGIDPWERMFWRNGRTHPRVLITDHFLEDGKYPFHAKIMHLPSCAVSQGYPEIVLFGQPPLEAPCYECLVLALILQDRPHSGEPLWDSEPIDSVFGLGRFFFQESLLFFEAGEERTVSVPGVGVFSFLWNGERLRQVPHLER